jgi:hypothetical protein
MVATDRLSYRVVRSLFSWCTLSDRPKVVLIEQVSVHLIEAAGLS